jgi:hypothetical protein
VKWQGINRNVRWTVLSALVLAAAACANSPGQPAHPATMHAAPRPVTESFAGHRFTVTFTSRALEKADADGTNLPQVVGEALARINALLPGPPTTITVAYETDRVINNQSCQVSLDDQTGTFGYTSPDAGAVTTCFGQTPQVSFRSVMQLRLPRDLAHEVDHSVRILAGPGFGGSLLEQIITEGIATAFDQAAFPGAPDPWDRAISPAQECVLWKRAQPLLGQSGLYDAWMFGQSGIPHWTGFTIGYDIVADYRERHPDTSWPAITAASAATILAGSHYQPCSS